MNAAVRGGMWSNERVRRVRFALALVTVLITSVITGIETGARADQPGFDYRITVADPRALLTSADHDALVHCAAGGLEAWRRWLAGKGILTVQIRVGATAVGR